MYKNQVIKSFKILWYILFLISLSCSTPKRQKGAKLFNTYCSMCHITPSIQDLPKNIWINKILPDMGARLGIRDSSYNPFKGLSFPQIDAINHTGVYPYKPIIQKKDWALLKEYVIKLAPDSIRKPKITTPSRELSLFSTNPISLDSAKGTAITFLHYDNNNKKLLYGDFLGRLAKYDFIKKKSYPIGQFGSAITDYTETNNIGYVTAVGYLNPSEISSGKIFVIKDNKIKIIPEVFHRPVNTLVRDLNGNGKDELVVSEFGNLSGKLTLLIQDDSLHYNKRILLNQPGAIRVLANDMNKDGKLDLIVLTAQGDEAIYILYQEDNLNFKVDKVIRFSPVYGSSWFELIDYDGDGDQDIITVNGDNGDKSDIPKPYHGMRININDGTNHFKEIYFFPMYGATRLVANDFDQDGDIDFGIVSAYPDYKDKPQYSFVYLENKSKDTIFNFTPHTFKKSLLGKWFLMDYGDIDADGDNDIILSSFTYPFAPAPDKLLKFWKKNNVDIMVLVNKLKNK